jgi:hypothetical protein
MTLFEAPVGAAPNRRDICSCQRYGFLTRDAQAPLCTYGRPLAYET